MSSNVWGASAYEKGHVISLFLWAINLDFIHFLYISISLKNTYNNIGKFGPRISCSIFSIFIFNSVMLDFVQQYFEIQSLSRLYKSAMKQTNINRNVARMCLSDFSNSSCMRAEMQKINS